MSLKRNTLYNLAGSIAPVFISLVTVPAFLHRIGDARYGVLAIVWLFLGYFGLFDPGITRAALFHIARLDGEGDARERESVFWTALVLNLAFGILGGTILYFAAKPVFMSTFKMPESMRLEVMHSLPWLAAAVPISITVAVLGGALQAREHFGTFNLINVISAGLTQLLPLGVAYWYGPELTRLIPAVLIARSMGAMLSFVVLIRALPLGLGGGFDTSRLKGLFSYGGWVTVTNILNPILSTMDRMLIGSLLSAEAVAFYTVPFNLVSRASVLPGALATSLFPRFSRSNEDAGSKLATDALMALAAATTPLVVTGIAALPVFMRYWVGKDFAEHSAMVGVILMVGVWVNGLAYIPYGYLQGSGRPDVVAKYHAIELIPFLGILWLGMHYFGLIGAALAWSARVLLDAILLFLAGGRISNWQRVLPGGLFVVLAAICSPVRVFSPKALLEAGVVAAACAWSWSLSPQIRLIVRQRVRRSRIGAPA